MRTYTLDARLQTIEEMIPRCGLVADIGCDHGRLGARLLLDGCARRVAFADISAPSLDKARALIRRLGLETQAAFFVGDGALALRETPDCAVIAGMGGETIAGIVEAGRSVLRDALLVMQPNVAQYELRLRLMRLGYRIEDERVVSAGRWYIVIAARPGAAAYDERELMIGPVLLKRRDHALRGYAAFRARVVEKALLGAREGNDPAAGLLAREYDLWKEIERWPQP